MGSLSQSDASFRTSQSHARFAPEMPPDPKFFKFFPQIGKIFFEEDKSLPVGTEAATFGTEAQHLG